MSRAILLTAISMLSVGALSACTSFRPYARTDNGVKGRVFGPARPGEASTAGDIGTRGRPAQGPATVVGRAGVDSRRACRAGSRPPGWIAIAYVSAAEGDCPVRSQSDSGATAAILTYFAERPVAAVLDVCADERIPSGWAIDAAPADAADACPGVERNGVSAHRIRRVR